MNEQENAPDVRLSYSSATLLQNCEQKYVHYKVLGTQKDIDASDSTEAFDIGKAFHQYLEDSLHSKLEDFDAQVMRVCKEFNIESKYLMIRAMIEKYLELHEVSGMEIVVCEPQITDVKTIGFIDVVMIEQLTGIWWIVDLKTSGMFKESIAAKLPKDYQLNLYSYFGERMAAALGLDPSKFGGCRYRVTTKPRIAMKSGEPDDAYGKRLFKSIKSYDIIIPKSVMDIPATYDSHVRNHERSMELRNGATPKRNLTYCESFFRPCEYWSQCHGRTNTACQTLVEMKTVSDYKAENELASFL